MRQLLVLGLVVAASSFGRAADPVELFKGDKLDLFTGKQDDWTFAKAVTLDEKNPKKLTFEAGSGILINGLKGGRPICTRKRNTAMSKCI